jgi:GDP-4-dehydro-6-deoxy-D-mannose reductase
VHLAAQSLVGPSWQDPALTYRVNVLGTIHLLESARSLRRPPKLLLAGSSAEYAEPPDNRLISETAPLEPNSPYASSKRAADDFALLCVRRYGLNIVRFRPFFIVGPRKIGDVCSDFARRIVAIERGEETAMRVGDLSPIRDMMDIRDGVSALLRLVDMGKQGEVYNICSGRGTSIDDILKTYCRLAHVPIDVQQDPALLRPLDQKSKIGDPSKLQALGWKDQFSLSDTLQGILDYWRAAPD